LVLKVRDERIESRSELVASQIKYPLYRADVVLYGRHYGSQAGAGEDEEEEKNSPETFPIRTRGDSGNNETNKSITLYLSTRNQLAAKFDRSVGRFGMEKRKGQRFAMRDS
jgi:hypothetical protein